MRIVEGRGFAFVEVPVEGIEQAIEAMNGKPVDGRNLTLNGAKPRESTGGGNRSGERAGSGPRW